ncbi:MAG: ABC-2 type transport system ATP-binding protein [Clostridium sp.]|jgi:ABC-2 type transport system ATP-binding protein
MKGYSHGMKNKMQMVCLFVTQPDVILLDEPLTSFDVVVALEIKNLLKKMKGEHIIIFSTHILQLATDLCDEILVLNNCVLEEVDSEILKSTEFEEKIMEILKEGGND